MPSGPAALVGLSPPKHPIQVRLRVVTRTALRMRTTLLLVDFIREQSHLAFKLICKEEFFH